MKTATKFLTVFFSLLVLLPTAAFAQTKTNDQIFAGCSSAPNSSICQDRTNQNQDPSKNPVNHLINVAASIIALITGIAAVIFVIVGGLTMVTSAGKAEAVANARKRITYAIIGLVIVALAWAIITFLTNKLIHT